MLHVLRQSGEFEIAGLLTTVNQEFNRVAMHGTRRELLEAQAAAAGLPLVVVPLPWPCSNQHYEAALAAACADAVASGIEVVAFGDLFLEDIRSYREQQLKGTGLTPVFPLWHLPTRELAQEMIADGLRARLATVDLRVLSADFCGREFDLDLLRDLPTSVDPCGENGEFHTAVYAGPMFNVEIPVVLGEKVEREGFCYADIIPRVSVSAG
jgi:uncharacterized protein (TIGR00290 family)